MKLIRLGVAAMTRKIYAGRVNKAGNAFLDGKQDVTSDFLKCVVDRFANEDDNTIQRSDGVVWRVTLTRVTPEVEIKVNGEIVNDE